ncbi:MAG: isoprenyl transferase [Clostridia bacterium]|nr:isoprenyl transferase [Clostridia bacterium]
MKELPGRLPRHVAIIMDGNGRWAQQRGLPRSAGHRAGVEALRPIIRSSAEWGISVLTVYAFSTENWSRPLEEVRILMGLVEEFFRRELKNLIRDGVKIRIIGKREGLSENLLRIIRTAEEETAGNTALQLNIAFNYGGREDIVQAARRIASEAAEGRLDPAALDEKVFADYLYTAGQEEVSLLIRTSGEKRISNFLLYQASYAEFVFTDVLWPDFTPEVYMDCLWEYASRDRRFGGVKEKKEK